MKKKKIVKKVGYARVSTDDRQDSSLENQIYLLKEAGCEIVFSEKGSGRNDNRLEFNKCINLLKELAEDNNNEVYLYVFKNDRLSRKFKTLITTIEDLIELNVNYISLVDHIDTSSIGGKMFFQMLSAFNEYEVSNTRERVILGLEKAVRDGKKLGRPKVKKATKNKVIRLYQLNQLSVVEIAKKCSVSTKTVYNILKKSGTTLRRNNA